MPSEETGLFHTVLLAALILVALTAVYLAALFRTYRKRRQLERREHHAAVLALEKERARFAADLHDDIGGTLAAIKMKLHRLPGGDANPLLEELDRDINDCSEKLRAVAFDMLPAELQRRGLVAAIYDVIAHSPCNGQLRFTFNHDEVSLDKEQELHILRVVQELLQNACKHANASSVLVELVQADQEVILHIKDDGTGFDKIAVVQRAAGLGLQNLMWRIGILHASIALTTAPGSGGTDYLIKIPLNYGRYNHQNPRRG